MKNKVVSIIILSSILLLTYTTFRGIRVGDFEILSVAQLKQKNNELDEKINEASELTSIKYPDTIQLLEETYEKHTITKEKYEELLGFTDEENNEIYETKQYDIGYLWKIFGKYATSRNLRITMDVQKKSSKESLYDLNFNVSGEYVNISQFITDIENNSDLTFRIYNFKMSGNGDIISSTFTVRNVNIDPSTLTTVSK